MAELKPRGSKARAGLAASLLLHAALITAAILSLPHWRLPPEPRGIEVSLLPLQPPPAPRRARPARPPPAPPPAMARIQVPQAPLPAPPPAQAAAPAAPAPAEDAEARAKVTALLRGSFGCSEDGVVRLSQPERDRCARWRRAQAKPGLVIPAPIEANKRAWFDATVAARNAPDHGLGGGCFGKPAHGIKLGPLPCYIELPKGPLSEDVDVPPEPEHAR
jgi:hypothetical protein